MQKKSLAFCDSILQNLFFATLFGLLKWVTIEDVDNVMAAPGFRW